MSSAQSRLESELLSLEEDTIRRVACVAEALVIVSVSIGFGFGCGPTVREGSRSNS